MNYESILSLDFAGLTDFGCAGCEWLKEAILKFEQSTISKFKEQDQMIHDQQVALDDQQKQIRVQQQQILDLEMSRDQQQNLIRNQQATNADQAEKLNKVNQQMYGLLEDKESLVLRSMLVAFRDSIGEYKSQLSAKARNWLMAKYQKQNTRRYKALINKGNIVAHEYTLQDVALCIRNYFDEIGQDALAEVFSLVYQRQISDVLNAVESDGDGGDDEDEDADEEIIN